MAEVNPNICDYCDHDDIEDLCVCTSPSCGQSTARCVSWCRICKSKFPCEKPITDHISCWDIHLPVGEKGKAAHERRPAKDQMQINEIFHCETDPYKQKTLHQRDKEARWFIIDPSTKEGSSDPGILYITDRFECLTRGNMASRAHPKQFPSLVSFIGETGAGKSTLIRALIKLYSVKVKEEALEIPVTRIRNAEHLTSPTSSGVHLYKDPATFASITPILFADCEGFNAGAAIPTSHCDWDFSDDERVVEKIQITSPLYSSTSSLSPAGRSGGVEDLYSRFLYAFSDVVCFVSRNTQTITQEIEKLLVWASRGLQTSVNQTQKKTLILILNAPNEHHRDWMDEDKVCDYIFRDMADVWRNAPILDDIRKKTNQAETERENQIRSTKDFIRKYFQKIRVCYVPLRLNIHSNEVKKQFDLLRGQIVQGTKETAEARTKTWTQYNIQELSRLFSQAFDHFATQHTPFDFYQAARQNNPKPLAMADHIMNLLRHIENTEDLELSCCFPDIVASSILNNALRGGQAIVSPHELWRREYAEKCKSGIIQFYQQHATCQFRRGAMRCISKYNVHDRIHRDKEGNNIGAGQFEPEVIQDHTSREVENIRKQFCDQYCNICKEECQWTLYKPSVEDIITHRRDILESYPRLWSNVYSYKTCFSCLCAIPDHVFPCGHAQCENCVSDFGEYSQVKEAEIILEKCVFCTERWEKPQLVQTRPPCAGIRVLTLDGGGVRGILELAILKKIEDKIGLNIGIQNFFDLVVGTSTGGIIALGLVVEGLSTEDMSTKFRTISTRIFQHTRGPKIDLVQLLSKSVLIKTVLLLVKLWDSVYSTKPLREELQKILGDRSSIFGSATHTGVQRSARVAVMAVKDGGRHPAAITNYNRPTIGDSSDFERAESEKDEIKAWEAGLCTAAAPIYFRPFQKVLGTARIPYLDGGLLNNNPIFWASSECGKIWRKPYIPGPDVLVSVGTGYFPNNKLELPIIGARYPTAALINSYFENIDGESTWEKFLREGQYDPDIHHRINVQFESKYCPLDDYKRMDELVNGFHDSYEQETLSDSNYSGQGLREKIDSISQLLVAKLFFFQPSGEPEIDRKGGLELHQLRGKILCRLEKNSDALKILVDRIDKFTGVEAIAENPHPFTTTTIGDVKTFKTAVRAGERFEIDYNITTTEPSKILQIFVRMRSDNESSPVPKMTISGFPCKFEDLRQAMKGTGLNMYKAC